MKLRLSACAAAVAVAVPVLLVQPLWPYRDAPFEPRVRLSALGASRGEMSDELLARRTQLMVESQTFGILRDPRAVAGAERINSPAMRALFESTARESGWPATLIAAVAYLESWGDPDARSPAGPKGIMQVAEGTARSMGLQVVRQTRYRVTKETRLVKLKKGKVARRTVRVRTPYTVTVRDDRFAPERAVPAAARYLARLERKFGGKDWAIFAYHCGEGCVGEFQETVRNAEKMGDGQASYPRAFFTHSPALNRTLHEAFRHHMERDFSPTYFFRVTRAQQLLEMHRADPDAFERLARDYRHPENPSLRAPHRLTVWLKPQDVLYQNCEDMRRESGRSLVRALDNPDRFGFLLRDAIGQDDPLNRDLYLHASPSAVGTLAYIAFETRRLHEAMKPRGERFMPLEVTSLVRPAEKVRRVGTIREESAAHCTGQVFDLATDTLPPGEREALEFVLQDMGWDGYLGFVEETPGSRTLHIGCSPSSRDFFTRVYQDALGER